jgi:hypothetical protein
MKRIHIQFSTEQAQALKLLAVREGKSVAELVRMSADALLLSNGVRHPNEQNRKAMG